MERKNSAFQRDPACAFSGQTSALWLVGGLALALSGCEGALSGVAPAGRFAGNEDGLGSGDGESELSCDAPVPGPHPLRRLTHAQYDSTLRDLLGDDSRPAQGFPAEARSLNFSGIADAQTVSALLVEGYKAAAEAAAKTAVGDDPQAFLGCDPTTTGCVESAIRSLTARAYRRPVTEVEVAELMDVFDFGVENLSALDGVQMVLEVILQSPDFLYRPEFGGEEVASGVRRLTSHEMATRISYFLTDSMPDAALSSAADLDQLKTLDQVEVQVERLMQGPFAKVMFENFHSQWLNLPAVLHIERDPASFPGFHEEIPSLLAEETQQFVSHVIFNSTGTLTELLTANYTMVNADLAAYYGLIGPVGEAFEVVELPDTASGILTQGGILAHHAHALSTSPVHRGKFVRENFFCQIPPPPPDDLVIQAPELDPNLTTRERFAQHSEDPGCAGCHELMDPIGLVFEGFDSVGRPRELENGLPVDVSGELVATDVDGPVVGASALGEKLAQSEQVAACMSRQWLRFTMGRSETPDDACSLARVQSEFQAADFDLQTLARAMTRTDAFLYLSSGDAE